MRRAIANWYVGTVVLVVLGVAIGGLVFGYVWPGKPKIGVIDIPFTIINDNSAFVIGAFLDYARRDPSIKGVVIRLNTPGGGAAASEQLYYQTRKLREKKPVVIVMNDIVASGGYMMSMGATYTYAKPSSFVGNVGVILYFPGALIPNPPGEQIMPTGPNKLNGGGRRYFVGVTDQLKQAFAYIVTSEPGRQAEDVPKRAVAGEDLHRGGGAPTPGWWTPLAVTPTRSRRLPSLAGVSNYGLVDVNTEVFRAFNQRFKRIIEPLQSGGDSEQWPAVVSGQWMAAGDQSLDTGRQPLADGRQPLDYVRRYMLPSGMGEEQERPCPASR